MNYGIVTIYVDKLSGDLFLVPNGESKKLGGMIAELNIVKELKAGFNKEELESLALSTMELCHSENVNIDISKQTVLEKFFKVSSYSTAVKNMKLVEFYWNKKDGYSVTPTKKIPRQGFVDQEGLKICLGKKFKQNELAESIIKAISLSE